MSQVRVDVYCMAVRARSRRTFRRANFYALSETLIQLQIIYFVIPRTIYSVKKTTQKCTWKHYYQNINIIYYLHNIQQDSIQHLVQRL